MIRGEVIKQLDHDPNFRWRGEAVTRIENLSDIVFALALGMLVSASTPPQTYADLEGFLISSVPVVAGFVILLGIWHDHFTFFRRYGVANGWIIFLNAILLFAIMYLAYPMRFVFESLFAFIISPLDNYQRMTAMEVDFERSGVLLAYFGIGFALIHAVLLCMYKHALHKKDLLNLSEAEQIMTKSSIANFYVIIAASLLTALVAYFTSLNGWAGFIMMLTWPGSVIVRRIYTVEPEAEASDAG